MSWLMNYDDDDDNDSSLFFNNLREDGGGCQHESDGTIYPHNGDGDFLKLPLFPPYRKCTKCGEFYR